MITNFTKILTVAAIAASVSQVAEAAFTQRDLYLGFTQGSAQDDYIIDLGQPAVLGVGGTAAVDLSSHFSLATFDSAFSGGPEGVVVAVVGGSTAVSGYEVYATQVRNGGPGNPAVAGSSLTASHSSSSMSGGASQVASIMSSVTGGLPTAGHSALDATKSYTAIVDTTGLQNNFIGKTGVTPFGTFSASALIYLDLYHATVSSNYTYLGYFTLDLSTSTPHLSFTPAGASSSGPPSPVLTISRTGTVNTISFTSANGANYNLSYTNSIGLTQPVSAWPVQAGSVSGNGSTKTFTDTTTDADRFYRVIAH